MTVFIDESETNNSGTIKVKIKQVSRLFIVWQFEAEELITLESVTNVCDAQKQKHDSCFIVQSSQNFSSIPWIVQSMSLFDYNGEW